LSRGPNFRSLYSLVIETSNTAKLVAALALVLVLKCVVISGARAQEAAAEPEVAARAWMLADVRSGGYLAGEDASARLPMASTTKIMVAVVALEEADLAEEVTVSQEAAAFATPAYCNVGLLPGDVLSVRELLMATMVSSGDAAAYALAESSGDGSIDDFVEMMNGEAEALALEDTHFENPIGLDARGQYSSARDLAEMSRLAMRYPEFREMVATDYATITTQDREIPLTNTNDLLFTYPLATGVKTGTTPAAGPTLVASAAAENESYVFVVLDAREDRFVASIRALEHGFAVYERVDLVLQGERYAGAEVPYRREETVELVAKESVDGLVDGSAEVEREAEVMKDLPGSARPGTRLGEVVVKVDGERVGESPLVARKGYDEASLWERVWYTVGGIFA
jgi:D-alanyl-D-alanine carboxypeptidase (penicillin-binding protein 5/6)